MDGAATHVASSLAWHPPCSGPTSARGGMGVCSQTLSCVAATLPSMRQASSGRDGAEESSRVDFSPPAGPRTPGPRLFADRRSGSDQRVAARRKVLASVSLELRRRVDRRGGTERRSTLERRSHPTRHAYTESPREHLRNALQLLDQLRVVKGLNVESRAEFTAALDRVRRALGLLERRTGA
jgi:hypothetical protein